MSIYYDYLSQDERSYMIESSSIDNEFAKLQTLYEMANLQLSQVEKEIEHKVFSESGSYDDYVFLLQEAGEENIEKKKGILMQIIDAIKRFFDKITGKSNQIKSAQIDPEEMISVPADLEEKSTIITGAMNTMQSGIAKISSGDFIGALSDLKKAVAPVAIVGITGGVAYKQIKQRKGAEINAAMEKAKGFFNGIWDKIKSFIPGLKDPKTVDSANGCFNPIKHVLEAIDSVISAISNGINKVLGGKTKSAEDQKKEDDSRLLAHNNVLEKPDSKGGKYVIDRTTGAIQYFDSTGKELPVDKASIPRDIIKTAQHLKGKAAGAAQEAKKRDKFNDEVRSKFVDGVTFTAKQAGAKVYINPTNANVYVNDRLVVFPKGPNANGKYKTPSTILSEYGVTKKHGAIIKAINAAKAGIRSARETKGEIDKKIDKTERHLRQESVCDYMNEVLANTVFEAVIEGDLIALVEYSIDTPEISDELMNALESDGFTVIKTDDYYEIYE